jgi:hypothetical protein
MEVSTANCATLWRKRTPSPIDSCGVLQEERDGEKFGAEYPGFKVLSYAAKYKDIQIEDGLACEWGEHESQFKMSPEAQPVSWHGTAFHVLKRQSDGS